jgi:hypothetical protein
VVAIGAGSVTVISTRPAGAPPMVRSKKTCVRTEGRQRQDIEPWCRSQPRGTFDGAVADVRRGASMERRTDLDADARARTRQRQRWL